MKTIFSIVFAFLFISINAQTTNKVLFLGNSYTYVNNLPLLIENLADANGDVLNHDQNTPGGYSLTQHAVNTTTLAKIAADEWDYVVIQAQSQEPSFPPAQVATNTKPHAETLVELINANNTCTKPLFYMTWGRQNGDASNCPFYPPICTYAGMQQRLRESYLEMTDENNAECAPVGMAWKKTREDFPAINLYATDGSHPSLSGSYLAACVFYVSMYNKTAVGNTYWSSLDSLTAFRLQNIASATVLDSLSVWHIETTASSFIMEDSIVFGCDSAFVNGVWYTSNLTISDTTDATGSCANIINYNVQIGAQTIDSIINSCGILSLNGGQYDSDTIFSDTISLSPCLVVVNYEITVDLALDIVTFDQNHLLKTDGGGISFNLEVNKFDTVLIFNGDSIIKSFYDNESLSLEYACPTDSFTMHFMLVAINNCGRDTAFLTAGCYSPITDLAVNSRFEISPNPANNFINISADEIAYFSASLINITGKELIEKQFAKNKLIQLDLQYVAKGMYFIVLYDENNLPIAQKRIVKK